jgi:hypothetical protein
VFSVVKILPAFGNFSAQHLEDCTKQPERAGFAHGKTIRAVQTDAGGSNARLFCAGGTALFSGR